jgi:hypothetical protein
MILVDGIHTLVNVVIVDLAQVHLLMWVVSQWWQLKQRRTIP